MLEVVFVKIKFTDSLFIGGIDMPTLENQAAAVDIAANITPTPKKKRKRDEHGTLTYDFYS